MADEAKQASGSGQQDAVSDKTQHLLGTATGNLSFAVKKHATGMF